MAAPPPYYAVPEHIYIGFRQPDDVSGPSVRLHCFETPFSFEDLAHAAKETFHMPRWYEIGFRFPVKDSAKYMKDIVILEEADMEALGHCIVTGKLLDPIVAMVEHVRYHKDTGAIIARKVKNHVREADLIGAHVKKDHPGLLIKKAAMESMEQDQQIVNMDEYNLLIDFANAKAMPDSNTGSLALALPNRDGDGTASTNGDSNGNMAVGNGSGSGSSITGSSSSLTDADADTGPRTPGANRRLTRSVAKQQQRTPGAGFDREQSEAPLARFNYGKTSHPSHCSGSGVSEDLFLSSPLRFKAN